MTNNPLPKLSSPVFLKRHRAFTKAIARANDPAFKQIWHNLRAKNLVLADQSLIKETSTNA
tara:strand:- start:432 stop:614 length:183 start_codon:yes stop_codon:yes gene_type:complete